jgi:hypothetical protein
MAKQLVKVQAIKTATTPVRTTNGTVPMFTNADGKADAKAREAKPNQRSAHKFLVEADVAEQLKNAGVVKIIDDGTDEADASDGTMTIADGAAETLKRNAQTDADENDVNSGMDTRDTTAFVGGTENRGGTTAANADVVRDETADTSDTADAPPASDGDEGAGDGDTADAPPATETEAKPATKPAAKRAPAKKAKPA